MGAIELVEKSQTAERPAMKSGDTVRVHVKVREGDKERIQIFEGIIIGLHRGGARASFTVRKVSFGQGVERIFPMHSPIIAKVDVIRSAQVRRAKLYFLRDLKGKAARMKDDVRVEPKAGRQELGSVISASRVVTFAWACATRLERARCGASGSSMSREWTRWGAAAWRALSSPARWCFIRTATSRASAIRKRCRRSSGSGSSTASGATPSPGRSPRPIPAKSID